MAPTLAEEKTLGQIHRNFNKLVNDAIKETTVKYNEDINYDDPDLDNLFKIDYACRKKDLEYVLKILKCKDILYCSRAIKGSTWLIDDPQYSNIINADYLFNKIFPEMITTARNKFLLHIRLHIRDERRAEDFFLHLKDQNLKCAIKWLPYCSTSFIAENIVKYVNDISLPVLMRLSEISLNFLHIYCNINIDNYHRVHIHSALKVGMKYANQNIEKYLDILDSVEKHHRPWINPKTTKLIMTKCPERILNQLEQYIDRVDIKTFAKYIKQDDIKDFLENRLINGNLAHYVGREIEHFIVRMPQKNRFEFVRKHFIDIKSKELIPYQCKPGTLENIYTWYRFASFEDAFRDLKKLIRIESNPSERLAMMSVILGCARNNSQNIHDLLEYYRAHHINEAFIFKISFINSLLHSTKAYSMDQETWKILNDLFFSMEVYTESDHELQSCIKHIILYKIIHNEVIPEIIISKFNFSTFKKERNGLNNNDREKVFEYLFNHVNKELDNHYEKLTKNDHEFEETIVWINNTLDLLVDWKKDLSKFPELLTKIRELSKFTKEKVSDTTLTSIYDKNKTWKKLLLNESIILNPSEDTCINALKHKPEIIHLNKDEIKSLYLNDKISMKRLFRKIRVYYTHLANEFKQLYYNNLLQNCGLRSTIIGLCVLLPPKELSSLIHKYIPVEEKINWNEIDEQQFTIQKHIAKNMHIARPQPALNLILLYAKGDYLQYVLSSLSSSLHNITSIDLLGETSNLNNTPVSLQKHIIREACKKLQFNEILAILTSVWKSTRNSSIRATVFRSAFNLLCRETNVTYIESIWSVLNVFIENLTADDNKNIFVTLSHVDKVPIQVRPAFCMKSYMFLKKLPEKSNVEYIIRQLITNTKDIIELMDADFMTEMLMESYEDKFSLTFSQYFMNVLSAFLVSSQSEQSQIRRFEQMLLPLLENADAIWSFEKDNMRKANVGHLFNRLCSDIGNIVIKKKMPMPVKLFSLILNKLEEKLPLDENYVLITNKKLALQLITILETFMKNYTDNDTESIQSYKEETKGPEINTKADIYVQAIRKFSDICLQYLIEDVQHYGTSIIIAYSKALNEIFENFSFCDISLKIELCNAILDSTERKEGYMLVLRLLGMRSYFLDQDVRLEIVKRIAAHSDSEVKILCSTYKYDF
ncbi:uncharacterized protein LOC119832758 isoform X2 [Zerene cesonia]|uniref:uncharacterized protein LOC119832758 isoform X2 n=1 Tax=Zerene cesonia TaxID=33412 RepID=UPI0018E5580B|nr:uncharacterized protein LOC119832758 isoform X2 [Zerene cesonia]